ncbi:MAG: hypothetical protein LBT38_10140 [Deltaproteobacteria bacterium]|jgi:hypothetical protein|nr:hypothetical protein [Deltaproteobacteria bacterium]
MFKIAKKNGRVKKDTAKATSQVFNSTSASANTLTVKDSGKALESTVAASVAPLLDTSIGRPLGLCGSLLYLIRLN